MRCAKCGYTTEYDFMSCPICTAHTDSSRGINPATSEKGGFWIRLLAFIVDNLVILFLSRIAGYAVKLGGRTIDLPEDGIESLTETFDYYIVIFLIGFYFTFFIGWTGQTIGKMLLGLKVVNIAGKPVGYGRAFLRYIGYHICFLTIGLGFLLIAVDRNKRGLHDFLAGTCVIRE